VRKHLSVHTVHIRVSNDVDGDSLSVTVTTRSSIYFLHGCFIEHLYGGTCVINVTAVIPAAQYRGVCVELMCTHSTGAILHYFKYSKKKKKQRNSVLVLDSTNI
jgi:hypothetical protein